MEKLLKIEWWHSRAIVVPTSIAVQEPNPSTILDAQVTAYFFANCCFIVEALLAVHQYYP
jgi:hypothetical protein